MNSKYYANIWNCIPNSTPFIGIIFRILRLYLVKKLSNVLQRTGHNQVKQNQNFIPVRFSETCHSLLESSKLCDAAFD
jgi:hypothetical protein